MTFKIPIHFLTYYSAGYKLPRDPLLSKTTSSVITKYFCNVMFPSFSRFPQSRHFLIPPHHELEPGPLTYHSKESLPSEETISEQKLLQSRRLKNCRPSLKTKMPFLSNPEMLAHIIPEASPLLPILA